jgi:hypothetical protein
MSEVFTSTISFLFNLLLSGIKSRSIFPSSSLRSNQRLQGKFQDFRSNGASIFTEYKCQPGPKPVLSCPILILK